MSVNTQESVVVVEDVPSFQVHPVIHIAAAGEREVSLIPLMYPLTSWREVRKSQSWRIRIQSGMKKFALLPI